MVSNCQQVRARFQARRDHLDLVCQNPEVSTPDKNEMTMRDRTREIAFDRLHWCRIPKVGTTYIQYPLVSLLKEWQKTHRDELIKEFSANQKKSFVFVREPYSRLVSGYFDKVLLTPDWWPEESRQVMVGAGLIEPSDKWIKNCAIHASFSDFITYFLNSEESGVGRNAHFIPIHDQCRLCQYNYTFIGHLETFKDDLDYILKSVNINVTLGSPTINDIMGKAVRALDVDSEYVRMCKCTSKYTVMKALWLSFQVRGFVSLQAELPVTKINSENITGVEFGQMAIKANSIYEGSFDKYKQKREMIRRMYQEVSLEKRLKLQKVLKNDFEMFQYDPQPPEVFPEFS